MQEELDLQSYLFTYRPGPSLIALSQVLTNLAVPRSRQIARA